MGITKTDTQMKKLKDTLYYISFVLVGLVFTVVWLAFMSLIENL